MPEFPPPYANRIRKFRVERALTQAQLAKLIGTHPSKISLYESEQVFPSGITLFRLAAAFNVLAEMLYPELYSEQRHKTYLLQQELGIVPGHNLKKPC